MTDLTLHIHSDLGWKGLPAPRSFRTWIELALKGAKRRRATEINVLITDAGIAPGDADMIRKAGVRLVVAR